MNIKYLAFEVNPVNQGPAVSNMGETVTRSNSYLQEIEERLRARAGNPVINEPFKGSQTTKPADKKDEKGEEKTLSKAEIQKIIDEFKF